jgi:hypothetical protein
MNEFFRWLLTTKAFVYITTIVTVCSAVHSVLPPWDWDPDFVKVGLAEFPTAQKMFYGTFNNRWYRVLVYAIGFVALNARSTFWKSISIQNPKSVNANLEALNGKVKVVDPDFIPPKGKP